MPKEKEQNLTQKGLGGGAKPTEPKPSQSGTMTRGQGGGKNIGAKPPKK